MFNSSPNGQSYVGGKKQLSVTSVFSVTSVLKIPCFNTEDAEEHRGHGENKANAVPSLTAGTLPFAVSI